MYDDEYVCVLLAAPSPHVSMSLCSKRSCFNIVSSGIFFSCSSILLSYFFFFALLSVLLRSFILFHFFLNTIQFSSIPIQCNTTSYVIYLHDPYIRIPSLSIILSPSQTNVSLRFVPFHLFAIWYIRRAIQAFTWFLSRTGDSERTKQDDGYYLQKKANN